MVGKVRSLKIEMEKLGSLNIREIQTFGKFVTVWKFESFEYLKIREFKS